MNGNTLMAHLPPGGYPNLATKQDLLDMERRLKSDLKIFVLWTILTANLGLAGLFTVITAIRS